MISNWKIRTVVIFAKKIHTKQGIHNWNHVTQVVRNVKKNSKKLNVNKNELIVAAYLHDIGYMQNENKKSSISEHDRLQGQHKRKSVEIAKPFLERAGFSNLEVKRICEIIRHHGIESAKKSKLFESKILCDADKMTQIGFGGFSIIRKRMKFRKEKFKEAVKNASRKNIELYSSLFTKTAKKRMRLQCKIMNLLYELIV